MYALKEYVPIVNCQTKYIPSSILARDGSTSRQKHLKQIALSNENQSYVLW